MLFPTMIRTEKMEASQCLRRMMGSSCVRMHDKTNFEQTRENRSKMQQDSETVRCTLLNGSAWCLERLRVRCHVGAFDIFFGIEHRMRRVEVEEHFNKEAEQGWRLAADAADHRRKLRAARTASTRRKESLLQSTAIWERSLAQKKGAGTFDPREGRKTSPSMGECQRTPFVSGTQKVGHRKMKA